MTKKVDSQEGEEFELDLGALEDSDLVELEALLIAEYNDTRSSEEFDASDEDTAEELAQIVATTKDVQAEITRREDLAASDDAMSTTKGAKFMEAISAKAAAKAEALAAEEAASDEAAAEAATAEEAAAAEALAAEEAAAADAAAEVAGDEKSEFAAKAATINISPKNVDGDKAPAGSQTDSREFGVVASADIRGFNAGQDLGDWSGVAQAFVAKRPDIRGTDVGADGNRFLVASVKADYPEERRLGNDIDDTMAKLNAVTSHEAITASGGLCAPLTPYYQLTTYGDACRPVRDSFPQFKADRGGIRFLPTPKLTDLGGSTRTTTAAEDAAGYTNQTPAGTTAPKPCLHVTCEAEKQCIIKGTSRCLTFGNMGARTYPEQVEAWIKLGMAEFARYTETELLDAVEANSVALSATQVYGATYSLLEQIALLVVSFRARHRLCSDMKMRAIFPFWIKEVLRSDLAAQGPGDGMGRYNVSDAMISDWLSVRGVNITWAQDHDTASGVPFVNPVVAGAIETWPTEVKWFLFPEGSFVYLEGGTLDLGLVRDSTLNSQNDYQLFYEEFNGLCFIGIEAYAITSTICPNGTYAPADALRTCGLGGNEPV